MYQVFEDPEIRLRKTYDLLTPDELKALRIKFNIDLETADAIYGFREGSYYLYENGLRLQSTSDDNLIRMTYPLDRNGFSILPRPKSF